MKHLEINQILFPSQFGFRMKYFSESYLLLIMHDFSCFMNSRTQVDIGILDFSKVFNKVDHSRLLYAKTWSQSFLSGRSQQVAVEGSSFKAHTLFLICINELVKDIQSTVRLFANDCLIYQPIYTYTCWPLHPSMWPTKALCLGQEMENDIYYLQVLYYATI